MCLLIGQQLARTSLDTMIDRGGGDSLDNQQGQAEGKGGNKEINPKGKGRRAALVAMRMRA